MSPIIHLIDNLERRSKRHLKYQRMSMWLAEYGELAMFAGIVVGVCVWAGWR